MKKGNKRLFSALALTLALALGAPSASAAWETGLVTPAQEKAAVEVKVDPADAFKADTLKLINEERAKAGLSALTGSDSLKKASNTRAQESSVKFAHIRPDGRKVNTVFTENEISYQSVGENLASGYTKAADLVKGWMNSKAHKDVLLSAKYTHAELGYFQNEAGKIYVALLLYVSSAA